MNQIGEKRDIQVQNDDITSFFVRWNGNLVSWSANRGALKEFIRHHHIQANLVVLNGFAVEETHLLKSEDYPLKQDDEVYSLHKNQLPHREILGQLMLSRHTPGVHRALIHSKVGIAGLGGLGSHVALALARMGIGSLVIVDFDVVEPTNLNRQAYTVEHLGQKKAHAMKHQLHAVHPYTLVEAYDRMISSENATLLFKDCDVIVEAFDKPDQKAMLVNTILCDTEIPIVAASGMAGLHSGNSIKSTRKGKRFFVVGDEVNGAKPDQGLMAPRVMIAAGHQALLVVQILTGQMTV